MSTTLVEKAPKLTREDRRDLKWGWRKAQGGCGICGKNTAVERHETWILDMDRSCCPKGQECFDCVRGVLCNVCGLLLHNFERNRDVIPRKPINGLTPFQWGERATAHLEGIYGREQRATH